jgi:hypothetical protein
VANESRGFEFVGSARFRLLRRLGAGGMGVVYAARDERTGEYVALKTLRSIDARHLLLFKNEFRALKGVHHPNLVRLGELFEEDGRWYFTMELLEGTSLLAYVRPRGGGAVSSGGGEPSAAWSGPSAGASSPVSAAGQGGSVSRGRTTNASGDSVITLVLSDSLLGSYPTDRWFEAAPLVGGEVDLDRLAGAMRQLAVGLLELHAHGKVHRDVKPSNVMVTAEQRVVLLDFGLVTDAAGHARLLEDPLAVGTPFYMAPEQSAGGLVGPAADWYSVGIMLYQALTGRLPFVGTPREMLFARTTSCPQPPSMVEPRVPRALDALCMGLLETRAADRLGGEAVLEAFGAPVTAPRTPGGRGARLRGRPAELTALAEAFAEARDACAAVIVRGLPGVGKTALLDAFVRDVAHMPESLVLAGSCGERESVPYRALDGVVDALSRTLIALPRAEAEALLPPEARRLGEVFPALRGIAVAAVRAPAARQPAPPHIGRDELVAGLRGLLGRVAAARRLVVVIDDFQWADEDSVTLLADVLREPGAPRLLLVIAERSGGGVAPSAALVEGDIRARLLVLGRRPPDPTRDVRVTSARGARARSGVTG